MNTKQSKQGQAMTAAEKRVEVARLLYELPTGGITERSQVAAKIAAMIVPDDEPAAPAQEPDWRDEVVSWRTGWVKRTILEEDVVERNGWRVYSGGRVVWCAYEFIDGIADPRSRCRAIDRFLSELAVEGVK